MAAYGSDVSADGSTKGVHLINHDGELLSVKQIQNYLIDAVGVSKGADALRSTGVNYHVVGIFGGQSSGKSTLLNCLFRTRFETMDEAHGRGQTTKGAFIARAKFDGVSCAGNGEQTDVAIGEETKGDTSAPLFVLDFEGTDGIERGENQCFERQLSLFALSVADTLVINMWAVDVGRFNAANMSLLRTIFEVNLQLFSHERYERDEKPTLLIVLRDFTGDYPEHYFGTVRNSFDKIWGSIVKPEAFKDSSIDALFDLRYFVLPHYKLQRAAFDKAIMTFREWFFLPSSSDNLFRGRGMLRGVPLDGISAYITNCWEVICSSKDLDIPTQREMLSRHRCAEAKRDAMCSFQELCHEYAECLHSGELVPRLTDVLDRKVKEILLEFNAQTKLYKTDILQETEAELKKELLEAELQLLTQYAKTIASTVVAELDTAINGAVDRTLTWMQQKAQSLPLLAKGGDGEGRGGGANSLHLGDGAVLMDNKKCNELVRSFWEKLCSALQVEVEMLCCESDGQRSRQPPAHLYGSYASYIAEDATLQEGVARAVFDAVLQKVCHRFVSMAENAADTIHQAFERILTHTPDGTVRFYNTEKGLQGVELKARQTGLVLLGCLLYYRLQLVVAGSRNDVMEKFHSCSQTTAHLISKRRKFGVRENSSEQMFFFSYTTIFESPRYPTGVPLATTTVSDDASEDTVDGNCVLLSQQALQRAFDIYTQKCGFTMQMQLRSIESRRQNLPVWVLPALLVLGWNEIVYVFTSPLLLLLVVAVAVLFFRQTLLSQWETFEETGPAPLVMMIRLVLQKLGPVLQRFMPASQPNGSGGHVRHFDPSNGLDVTAAGASSSS